MLRPSQVALLAAMLAAYPALAQDTTEAPAEAPAGDTAAPAEGTDQPAEGTAAPAEAADQTAETAEPAAPADPDTVVATVDGTDITLGHMAILRAGLPQQYQQLPPETLFGAILDQLIQQLVLAEQTTELDAASQKALENEERALRANVTIRGIAEGAMTDEALQQAYDAAYGDAEPSTEYNASHILVETEEEAAQIVEELEGGADFAEVARERSTGPSGPSGGSLGWFGPGQMVAPFEEAVMALEPGQTSAPVQTQFGWHVIHLNETRDKAVPTVDEVRDELAETIQRAAVEARIAELTEGADVERMTDGIDPSVINDPSLYAQ